MEATKALVDIVKEAIEALNNRDRDRLGSLLAKDVTFTEVPANQVVTGRDEVLTLFLETQLRACPDRHARIIDVIEGKDRVGLDVIWTGTHLGEFVTPFGTLPPTGKQFTMRAFITGAVNEGKITSIVEYYDSLTILTQLGLFSQATLAPA